MVKYTFEFWYIYSDIYSKFKLCSVHDGSLSFPFIVILALSRYCQNFKVNNFIGKPSSFGENVCNVGTRYDLKVALLN